MNSKNVAYTVVGGNFGRMIMGDFLPHQEKYFKSHQIDFYQLDESFMLPEYPTYHFLYFRAFEHFLESDYDRFLFIDLDIIPIKDCKNIFNEYPSGNLYMRKGNASWQKYIDLWNAIDANYAKGYEDGDLFNGGVILCDREHIEKFIQYLQPPFYKDPSQGEQGHFNLAFRKAGIIPTPLEGTWNFGRMWLNSNWNKFGNEVEINSITDINFLHYAGCGNKIDILRKDLKHYGDFRY